MDQDVKIWTCRNCSIQRGRLTAQTIAAMPDDGALALQQARAGSGQHGQVAARRRRRKLLQQQPAAVGVLDAAVTDLTPASVLSQFWKLVTTEEDGQGNSAQMLRAIPC